MNKTKAEALREIHTKLSAAVNGKPGSAAFYAAFSAVYFRAFFQTTMFTQIIPDSRAIDYPAYAAFAVLCLLGGLKALECLLDTCAPQMSSDPPAANKNGKQAWFRLILIVSVLLSGFLCWYRTGNKAPFMLCGLAAAGMDRRLRPALLISAMMGSAFMAAAYLASMNGYIAYLTYDMGKPMLAHAFGICYRTDFGAHVLYLVMFCAILRGEKLHLWEYLMFWFDTWVVWRYSAARMDTVCLILFLTALGALHLFRLIKHRWPRLPRWTAAVHAAFFIGTFVMLRYYPESGTDASLDARVRLSLEGFAKYPLRFFGNAVAEKGGGGLPDHSAPYFFLDIAYVRMVIVYGIAVTTVYLLLMTMASYRAVKSGDAVLALSLAIVAGASVIEHHATEMAYNVLILAGTASIENTDIWLRLDKKRN